VKALSSILLAIATAFFVLAGPQRSQAQDPEGDAAEGTEEASPDEEGWEEDEDESGWEEEEPEEEPFEEPEEEEETGDAEEPADEDDGDEAEDTLGGHTTRLLPSEPDRGEDDHTLLIPPLYLDRRGDTTTSILFPLYFRRSAPQDRQLLIGPYYQRRAFELNVDVVFPFYWSFRGIDYDTWSVPPVYHNRDADGFDWGIAPLIFDGRSDDSVYTVIPPLLTASWANDERAYTFAGPFWRIRKRQKKNWGIFPLLWASSNEVESSFILAPLIFRFADEEKQEALTIVPPFYHRVTEESATWGLAPLLHHMHDEEGSSWTVPPALFHYSKFGEDLRLITPLFGYFDVDDHQTLVTPLYQRYRGETNLDAVAPFFFSYRNPRQHSSSLLIPPLFWHFETPAESTDVLFPLFGRWHERGRYTTFATPLFAHYQNHEEDAAGTWIAPNIQFSHTPESSTFNLHPLVYSTSARTHRHLVLAPIYWDFEDYEDRSRTTIAFPFLWRFRNGSSVTQVAIPTYYRYERDGGVPGWEFHFFPLFAFGSPRPGDHWWSILYGLAGYKRQGRFAKASAFWIPFQVDGPEGD